MLATSPAAKLRAEVGALDLIEVTDFPPGLITDRAGNVNFEPQDRHWISSRWDMQSLRSDRFFIPIQFELTVREPPVQHEIDDHACNGDIHPEWPCPPGD